MLVFMTILIFRLQMYGIFFGQLFAVSALASLEPDKKVEKAHLPWRRMGCEKILNPKKWVRTEVKGLFF